MKNQGLRKVKNDGNNTYLRVDPNTLAVYADADSANASVFDTFWVGDTEQYTKYQWTGNGQYLDLSGSAILANGSENDDNTTFEHVNAQGSSNYGMRATNGELLCRNTNSNQILADGETTTDLNCVFTQVYAG